MSFGEGGKGPRGVDDQSTIGDLPPPSASGISGPQTAFLWFKRAAQDTGAGGASTTYVSIYDTIFTLIRKFVIMSWSFKIVWLIPEAQSRFCLNFDAFDDVAPWASVRSSTSLFHFLWLSMLQIFVVCLSHGTHQLLLDHCFPATWTMSQTKDNKKATRQGLNLVICYTTDKYKNTHEVSTQDTSPKMQYNSRDK